MYLEIKENIMKIFLPIFPYDGKILQKKGIKEGKKIGLILKELELVWIENEFNLSDQKVNEVISKFN